MASRVVLAMSGGVDSSVAAHLLRRQGHEVIGLFMRTGVVDEGPEAALTKTCCSSRDAADARRVADLLDIPFYVLDFAADFGRIMDYFADEYLQGRTPNPCVVCNTWLKFGKLWAYGQQLQADFIATGHYARIVTGGGQTELHRAVDLEKDQSYVLFGLQRRLLPQVLFPLGGLAKDTVRTLARDAGLGVHGKPDSVEICFVPDNDHAAFIRRRRPERDTAGCFVDTAGNILAAHQGIERYTIGQRKGLGYAAGSRRYVLRIIPQTNQVVLGQHNELLAATLRACSINWLIDPPTGPLPCTARIRYRHQPAPATLSPLAADRIQLEFSEPQSAITPGQAVVFYAGSQVLGGGWITESGAG